ncbi:MAG: bile acid:sodium symporter [Desulfocapsa sp.]|nr:bile acid:sodium symporter [Desulfocapsa sp.]
MKQFFLPLGLLSAVCFAFFLPAGGVFLRDNYGLKILVCTIFLVSGYQTGSKGLALDRKLFTLFLTAAFISLLLAPFLGLLVSRILHFPLYLAMGLIIISTVPPTISSGVIITEVSRGNAVLALFLTISLNLLGIFTMPFILDLCLKVSGPIDIDQTALLMKMLFLVLLPFIIGKTVRNLTGRARISPLWSYINSSCIILIVYSSIATSKSAFTGLTLANYAQVLAGVASIHLLLLAINMQAGKTLRLSAADNKAMLFVTSQKTLAIALAVLASVNFETGNAIIVCLMFHFFQLFVDSFLASIMQKKTILFSRQKLQKSSDSL